MRWEIQLPCCYFHVNIYRALFFGCSDFPENNFPVFSLRDISLIACQEAWKFQYSAGKPSLTPSLFKMAVCPSLHHARYPLQCNFSCTSPYIFYRQVVRQYCTVYQRRPHQVIELQRDNKFTLNSSKSALELYHCLQGNLYLQYPSFSRFTL